MAAGKVECEEGACLAVMCSEKMTEGYGLA